MQIKKIIHIMTAFALMFCVSQSGFSAPKKNQTFDVTVASFPKVDGETSDSPRIQRAINAASRGVLYIPSGLYELDEPLKVNNGASLMMHKSARFVAIKAMDFMLDYNGAFAWEKRNAEYPEDHNLFISGGDFDARGLASCVLLQNYHHFTFRDTTFRNGKHYGLKVRDDERKSQGYELIATNLYCRCNMSGLAGNVGICTDDGDSHYTDCVVIDYTTGIYVRGGGSNRLTRCHIWGGPIPPARPGEMREMLKDSVCFRIAGGDTVLRDCYADTGMTGFLIEGTARVLGCAYFNNWGFKMDNPTVFEHVSGRLVVTEGFFSKKSPKSTLYKGDPKDGLIWRDNVINGFKQEEIGLPKSTGATSGANVRVYDFEK